MLYSKEYIKNKCEMLIDELRTPALKKIISTFCNMLYEELENDSESYLER